MREMPTFTKSDLTRFWSKVDKSGECWEWTGSKLRQGYGNFKVTGEAYLAQTFVLYQEQKRPMYFMCHSCDNPSCVNPRHLWLGSNSDNMSDRVSKNRQVRGEAVSGSRLTEKIVREILESDESDKVICERLQIDPRRVSDIRLGKKWRWVPGKRRLSRQTKEKELLP